MVEEQGHEEECTFVSGGYEEFGFCCYHAMGFDPIVPFYRILGGGHIIVYQHIGTFAVEKEKVKKIPATIKFKFKFGA